MYVCGQATRFQWQPKRPRNGRDTLKTARKLFQIYVSDGPLFGINAGAPQHIHTHMEWGARATGRMQKIVQRTCSWGRGRHAAGDGDGHGTGTGAPARAWGGQVREEDMRLGTGTGAARHAQDTRGTTGAGQHNVVCASHRRVLFGRRNQLVPSGPVFLQGPNAGRELYELGTVDSSNGGGLRRLEDGRPTLLEGSLPLE
ncbi:hypothetical protein GGX14DRAFT_399830 [Mycena pura]|uniref:Uncharacterized protein n=1 Tax=Mycena pura TaxID=153505 RepID=A0AAD6V667_9AGAR|nr:hypothetical protein GGX14DRAFT_399830 [Mycena pura]